MDLNHSKKQQAALLKKAVINRPTDIKRGLWDKLFTKALEGLV